MVSETLFRTSQTPSLPGEVIVALDSIQAEKGIDGIADQLFILQQDRPWTQVSAASSSATVVFTDSRLAIRFLDSPRAWILYLPEDNEPRGSESPHDVIQMMAHQLSHHQGYEQTEVIRGFGLSHHQGDLVPSGDTVELAGALLLPDRFFFTSTWRASEPFEQPFSKTDPMDDFPSCAGSGTGGTSCDSGGYGSTSCSVSGCSGSPTGCSTSCSSGRYSCCKCLIGGASCTCSG